MKTHEQSYSYVTSSTLTKTYDYAFTVADSRFSKEFDYSFTIVNNNFSKEFDYSFEVVNATATFDYDYSFSIEPRRISFYFDYDFKIHSDVVEIEFIEDNDYLIPISKRFLNNKKVNEIIGYPVKFDYRLTHKIKFFKISKAFIRKFLYAIENNDTTIFDGESKRIANVLIRFYSKFDELVDDELNEYGEPISNKDKHILNGKYLPLGSMLPDEMLFNNNTYSLTPDDYSKLYLADLAITYTIFKEPIKIIL